MTVSDPPKRPESDASAATPPDPTSQNSAGRSDTRRRTGGSWGKAFRGLVLLLIAFGGGYLWHELSAPPDSPNASDEAGEATAGADEVWTCSMHPQIRQPKPGLCPLCAMDLIPASTESEDEATSLRELSISREARELLNIESAPVERRHATATIRMVGKVDYDETRLGSITAWVPGRLDRLYVDYTGIEVKKGDHMVSIYSPELFSAQAELIRAREAARDRRSTSTAMSAERLLESAREKLRLWGLTEGQIREIEQQDRPADRLTIYAPMSGVVITKELQEGAYVETGTRIYTIADLNQVWVRLDAYESDLVWLRYGQEVEFTTEAYAGEVFLGRIAFIDPVLNPRTRTVKVRVDVPNPQGKLKPEMFVNGRVRAKIATGGRVMVPDLTDSWICRMHPGVMKDESGDCDLCGMPLVRTETLGYVSADAEQTEPIVVPASAVLQTGTRAIVYVERPDADRPTFEGREVVLGPRAGDVYLVHGGLSEGERVVVNGNFKLDSALQLLARPSMMSPDAGAATGAGHHHGASSISSKPAETADDRLQLPITVATQMARVASAAQDAAEVLETGDREALRSALRSFEETLDRVDKDLLEGQAARVWKELAMRLRNDAVEGRWAASDDRIRAALSGMMVDVDRLRSVFNVPETSGPMLVGGPFEVPDRFREQLGRLWEAYLQAQQALANDDPNTASTAAITAKEHLESIEMSLLDENAHEAWMLLLPEFQESIDQMAKLDDLEALRSAFEGWSIAMTPALSSFGINPSSGPVYQLYCSMAFQNQGASWLQANEDVRNPYFGASMLKCANTVEPLRIATQTPDTHEGHDHD